jgi:hypothetical protein
MGHLSELLSRLDADRLLAASNSSESASGF